MPVLPSIKLICFVALYFNHPTTFAIVGEGFPLPSFSIHKIICMWFGIITNLFTNTNGYFLLMSKMYFSTIFHCPVNCGRGRSRLPPRSVLTSRRGVHRTPAPLPYNVAENFCFIIGTYRNKIISVFAIIKIFEPYRFSFG